MYKKGLKYLQQKSSKAFLYSLLASLFVWGLTNFSKTYTKTIPIPLVFEEVNDGELLKASDTVVYVSVRGTGFSMFRNNFSNKKHYIDTKKIMDNGLLEMTTHSFNPLFSKSIEVLSISPTHMKFNIEKLAQKKVPIHYNLSATPKQGYGITSRYLEKDSMFVYGLAKKIAKINRVNTVLKTLSEVSDSVSGKLLIAAEKGITYQYNSLAYAYAVEPFTEGVFQLKIKIKNVPSNTEVVIFPKDVSVRFQAPLSVFESYTSASFNAYVDYNEIQNNKTLPIHVNTLSKGAKNVLLLKKKVSYLIVKK